MTAMTPANNPPAIDDIASQPFTKHPTLWLDDGNIVLIAEDVGFKVHRSLLAKSSGVFGDMLSVPQPETADELIEGCPVVRLADDGKEELETVLGILFDGRGRNFYKDTVTVPFDTVVHALRMGMKYQFHDILQEALARLTASFPTRLEDFHNGVAAVATFDSPNLPSNFVRPIELVDTDAMTVVRLARSFGLDDLLPAALYTCAQLPYKCLLSSLKQGKENSLTIDDLSQCLEVRDFLHTEHVLLFTPLAGRYTSPDCPQNYLQEDSTCRACIAAMLSRAIRNKLLDGANTFFSLSDWFKDYAPCDLCIADLNLSHRADQERIWTELRERCAQLQSGTDSDPAMGD